MFIPTELVRLGIELGIVDETLGENTTFSQILEDQRTSSLSSGVRYGVSGLSARRSSLCAQIGPFLGLLQETWGEDIP